MENEKVKIDLEVLNFAIYASFHLIISDIIFESTRASLNNINSDDLTVLMNKEINYTNKFLFNGFFVLEAIIDQDIKKLPVIEFQSVIVLNLLASNEVNFPFSYFLKIYSFGGCVIMNDITFENIYFSKNLIFNEIEPQNHDEVYNFNPFQTYFSTYKTETINMSKTVQITNITIDNFNQYQFNNNVIGSSLSLFYFTHLISVLNFTNVFINNLYSSSTTLSNIFDINLCQGQNIILNVKVPFYLMLLS